MPLITDYNNCLELFAEASERKWVLPNFNSENLTTTEAILQAAKEFGEVHGINDLLVIIGITNNYPPRPQSVYYTHTRKWDVGLKLFLSDLQVLTSAGSPYEKIRVMVHLDHILFDQDEALLEWDMRQFSSIMFDASSLPFERNIKLTSEFVERNKGRIVIEGACDEISKSDNEGLTTPYMAERFFNETGVNIIVANLGTEHRASASTLFYRSDLAKQISRRVGPKLCLHGTSSVSSDQLKDIFNDGICKVNIWTVLERDSAPVLFNDMLNNASKIIGPQNVKILKNNKQIGELINDTDALSITHFTSTYRQQIVFQKMKEIVKKYLGIWYTI